MLNFFDKIRSAWEKKDSMICVGLDTDLNRIPSYLKEEDNPLFKFNTMIIHATADLVCAYKPQIAYYSAVGAEKDLALTIDYIHTHFPDIPVILDAKRGDIGSTAQMYSKEVFDRYKADAVTLNPYMGGDTLTPFLNMKKKGIIILCRTSNPGSQDFQDLVCKGKKLFHIIAEKAVNQWNYNKNVALVAGATFPEELKEIRQIVGGLPLLIPGLGKQGGDIKKTVQNGQCVRGRGMIINSSRGILYAGKEHNFEEEARNATLALRDIVNSFRLA